MTDLEKGVWEWCTAASPLQTEISGRMWTPIAHQKFKNDSGKGSIVFHKQNSRTHPTGAMHSPVYVFKCYGGTDDPDDARKVSRLLYDRIHHANGATDSGRIVTAEVVGGGGVQKEPDTKFWTDISIYQISSDV